jgi:hypothetical protein
MRQRRLPTRYYKELEINDLIFRNYCNVSAAVGVAPTCLFFCCMLLRVSRETYHKNRNTQQQLKKQNERFVPLSRVHWRACCIVGNISPHGLWIKRSNHIL